MRELFRRIATAVSNAAGRASTFFLAVLVVLVWAFSGHYFAYSDTWQLVINTGTTIITFLMVFLIQNTQSRDGKALQIKLDELLRATRANDSYIDIEDLSDEELQKLSENFKRIREVDGPNPALDKFHKQLQEILNARFIKIPGEEQVTKFIQFTENAKRHKK